MNAIKELKKVRQRLVLHFPAHRTDEPVTYNLIKNYDVVINILNADISHGKEGSLLVEIEGGEKNMKEALGYLKKLNVQYEPVGKSILFNEENCVHCGACAAVCFPGALVMERESRELRFEPENCIACELCIKACPLQLFELNFGIH